MNGDYYTVSQESEQTIIIQKSRFIGRCFPIASEQDALLKLDEIRKQHWDATHNCYAYVIGTQTARYSDDGEPGGTAGLPMMEVLKARELRNLLVIVTRYFGGVLLGAGGLVRAYSKAASTAVDAAGVAHMIYSREVSFESDYALWGKIERKLRAMDAHIEDIAYIENVCVKVLVPYGAEDNFISEIIEISDGKIMPRLGAFFYLARQ